jgi:hypothetical protein
MLQARHFPLGTVPVVEILADRNSLVCRVGRRRDPEPVDEYLVKIRIGSPAVWGLGRVRVPADASFCATVVDGCDRSRLPWRICCFQEAAAGKDVIKIRPSAKAKILGIACCELPTFDSFFMVDSFEFSTP